MNAIVAATIMLLTVACSSSLAQTSNLVQVPAGRGNVLALIPLNNISPALVAQLLGGVVIYDVGPGGAGYGGATGGRRGARSRNGGYGGTTSGAYVGGGAPYTTPYPYHSPTQGAGALLPRSW